MGNNIVLDSKVSLDRIAQTVGEALLQDKFLIVGDIIKIATYKYSNDGLFPTLDSWLSFLTHFIDLKTGEIKQIDKTIKKLLISEESFSNRFVIENVYDCERIDESYLDFKYYHTLEYETGIDFPVIATIFMRAKLKE